LNAIDKLNKKEKGASFELAHYPNETNDATSVKSEQVKSVPEHP